MIALELKRGNETEILQPAAVGKIVKQRESRSYEFKADDYTFDLRDGEAIFSALEEYTAGSEMPLRVFDTEWDHSNPDLDHGETYFSGFMIPEGTSYSEEDGIYKFRAVHTLKFHADAWRLTPARFRLYKNSNGQPDIAAFPVDYLERTLTANANMKVVVPKEYKKSTEEIPLDTGGFTDASFSVYDLMMAACMHMNTGMVIEDGVLYFRSRNVGNRNLNVYLWDVTRYIRKLRSPEYKSVAFRTTKGTIGFETATSFRAYKPEDFAKIDKTGCLDMTEVSRAITVSNWSNMVPNPLSILFPPRTESKQNTWDEILSTKKEIEIGFNKLIALDPADRLWFGGNKSMRVERVEYDMQAETTLVIGSL